MPTSGGLRLVAFTAVFAGCGAASALAQPASQPAPVAQPAPATPAGDGIAMPDDLGAPMAGMPAAAAPAPAGAQTLSVNSPIARIAANPQGKAALEKALPGLCERAEYPMFKSMTLRQLAGMSSGRITEAKLDGVQADLTRIGPVETTAAPSGRGMFYPLTHTAHYTVLYGGRQIKLLSHSLYHRVALVVASL